MKPYVLCREKRALSGLLIIFLFFLFLGCSKPYVASNFETNYKARTRAFAIAPIANMSTEPEGVGAGEAIRQAIFYELSRRQENYTVDIQDIAMTHKKIQEGSMTDSSAALLPAPDLCKLLGVDAVMKGSVTRYKKKGAAGQIATAILFGSAKGSEVEAAVAIYDGIDGKLIWHHNIEKAGGFLSSPDALRNKVGKTVAKKFPYKKK